MADDGTSYRPGTVGKGGLFFVPQRPYITQGTLRAQILYPSTEEEQDGGDDEMKV